MIGEKFNDWVIVDGPRLNNSGRNQYLCRCKCGKESYQYIHVLKANKTKRCAICTRKPIEPDSVFGKWKVLEVKYLSYATATCSCECGIISIVKSSDLKSGKTTQCLQCYKNNRINTVQTHGLSSTPIYRTWRSMKDRCRRELNKDYKYYGARGITVCESWLKFENFLHDMGENPGKMQLDRIDNDKGYYKENCRWVTAKQNCNNRRKKSANRNTDKAE